MFNQINLKNILTKSKKLTNINEYSLKLKNITPSKNIILMSLLSFCLIFTSADSFARVHKSFIKHVSVYKISKKVEPEIYSVIDLDTGTPIEKLNTEKVHSLASITKLMTAYVLIKNHPDLSSCNTKITKDDRGLLNNTKSRIDKNQSIGCEKLVQAMLVSSDNWAAMALSKVIPGVSSDQFVELMNSQAVQWNMKSTFFKDPSGLSSENISTADDLMILMKKLQDINLINQSSKKEVVMETKSGSSLILKNTNRILHLGLFEALLSKTGYIRASLYNLIFVPKGGCAKQNIGFIIMGSSSSTTRANFAQRLLNKYECFSVAENK